MTGHDFNVLKSIYSSSKSKTVICDKDFIIRWINDERLLSRMESKSALALFQPGSEIPFASGSYTGMLNGKPYRYNVIRSEYDGEAVFILEILSEDAMMEFLTIPEVMNFVAGFDANIRQAVFGIASASSTLYDVLEATESYNEISVVNTQVRACYKILKSVMLPNEILKYVYDVMEVRVIHLSRFLSDTQEVFDRILGEKKSCITLEAEENLYVRADEERMQYMLIDAILYIIKHTEGIPSIQIHAKVLAEDILLSVSNGTCTSEDVPPEFVAYTQQNSAFQGESSCGTDADLYITNLFCRRFNGNIYTSLTGRFENAIGIRLPAAKESDFLPGESLKTEFKKYASDRFSPFYIGLADIFNFNFYAE